MNSIEKIVKHLEAAVEELKLLQVGQDDAHLSPQELLQLTNLKGYTHWPMLKRYGEKVGGARPSLACQAEPFTSSEDLPTTNSRGLRSDQITRRIACSLAALA